MPAPKTIGGSFTGLRWATETSTIGTLPGSGVIWYSGEPNDYGDFGPEITTLARDPISGDRQSKKGMVVGLTASANFTTDFTQTNVESLMESFFFAAYRAQGQVGGNSEITSASGTQYIAGAGFDAFLATNLAFASGFTNPANNGLKVVTASTATTLDVAGLVAEAAPPSAARVVEVGIEAAAGDIDVDSTQTLPAITSTVLDFTTLGWYPGMWVHLGDDLAGSAFSTAANNGFKRIVAIAANRVDFDKSLTTMVTEAPAGAIRILYPTRGIRNEVGALIIRTTLHLERDLGAPDTDFPALHQFEYVTGAVGNTLALTIGTQDKVTMDMGFMGLDGIQRTSAQGALAGSRPDLIESDAFNTSSDFSMMRLSPVSAGTPPSAELFAFLTEVQLDINNNATGSTAIGSLPAIDITVGKFKVSGNITAYFTDVAAIAAVRNNDSITLDLAMVKNNAGVVVDVPLLTLGDGRLNIEQDTEITIPVSLDAASGALVHPDLDYTLAMYWFDYLPDLAE